jgi:two-component system, OmpR family, alkaline phosphatase synthesis response regulator PhoP
MSIQIMLVDDEAGMLDLIGLILNRQGFSVLKVQDASTALELLESITPDLIILDVMMPGIDGIELCRQLRTRPQTSQTPVIFLSARTDPITQQKGFEAGANHYLSKLAMQRELVPIVHKLLGRREGAGHAASQRWQ